MRCPASLCTLWTSAHFTWLFLKILTSVLNRFHSEPLHRVSCQLLSSERRGRNFFFFFLHCMRGCNWWNAFKSDELFIPPKQLRMCSFPWDDFPATLSVLAPCALLRVCAFTCRLRAAHLRGLLGFHRHLGIPYMPREPITHLRPRAHFDLDREEHFPRSAEINHYAITVVTERFMYWQ